MSLTVHTAPTTEPITLTLAKLQLRVSGDLEDDLITHYIQAAREYCESYQGRAYFERTYILLVPFAYAIQLPRPPLGTVKSVTLTQDGTDTALTLTTQYLLDLTGPLAVVNIDETVVPTGDVNTVSIEYTAGDADADDIPARMKQAMLMLITHWYDNRGVMAEGAVSDNVAFTVRSLLDMDCMNW